MRFTKMQGIGNDYVYINCFRETVEDPAALAVRVSDRHFGIGSDGLILIKPSQTADFEMDMYNADGSRGKMCGNGIRCVARYVYDYGLTDKTEFTVATGSGIKHLQLTLKEGQVSAVTVDMGSPVLEADQIPAAIPDSPVVNRPVRIGGKEYRITCVSMGNPHCIVPVDDPDSFPVETIGPLFETDPMFPDRVNTEFIRVLDRHTVRMRVWERGSGETLACGTGACAVAAACILNGWTEDHVTVRLLGGDLDIFWNRQENTILMTGPAQRVFDGELYL